MPKEFIWGVSTSSYQIEGATTMDGRGPSIWDTFCQQPNVILDHTNGDIACDYYHRYAEDVDLMQNLGVDAYRFSVSWPRIFPQGIGALNHKGLAFYDRIVDLLLEKNIQPWVCLHHWDFPQALQQQGGWVNRDSHAWFCDYATSVCQKLGDRVQNFTLINEHNVIAWLGYLMGIHAPGEESEERAFAVAHHLNLAQGMALQSLRTMNSQWKLGTIVSLSEVQPLQANPEDKMAAEFMDALWNRCFLDPLYKGEYPTILEPFLSNYIHQDDLANIQQSLDFLGVNYYTTTYAQAPYKPGGKKLGKLTSMTYPPADKAITALRWEIAPDGFYNTLLRLKNDYGNPEIFITENGAAFLDKQLQDGRVQDHDRIQFYQDYLQALFKAKQQGVNVKGYFAWTLLDNFEWAEGYTGRFGLVHVERKTLKRTPKASYYYYQDVIKNRLRSL